MAARQFGANPQAKSNFLSPVPYQRDEYNLDVQNTFTRQSVGVDSLHYDEQTANYHGQTSPGYMLSSNSSAILDYSTAWGNRGWDPVLGRPAAGEFFDEQNTQAAYGFILPGQSMTTDMPQPTGAGAGAGAIPYTESVDRTLPTPPTCRTHQTPTTLTTLPDNHPGISLVPDTKTSFWNPRYPTSPDTRTIPIPVSNSLYPLTQARMKQPGHGDTTPDLIFDMPPSTAANPPYPSLDTIESPIGVGGYSHDARFSRDGAGQRLLALTSDCAPDVYGYASGRKRGDAEARCSAPTLMGGLPYTRVRHADSGAGLPFSFLLDSLPEYGRVESVHRSPVSPLGGHQTY
jgi:hypothetical protein